MVIKVEIGDPSSKIKMTDHSVDTLELTDIWFAGLAYPTEARLEMIRQHNLPNK